MNKDQPITQPVFIAIITVIVLLACFAGYYFFIAPQHAEMSDQSKKMYMEKMKQGPTSYTNPGMPGSGGAPTSGGTPSSGGAPTSGGSSSSGGQ